MSAIGPGQTLQQTTYTATGVIVATWCAWDVWTESCQSSPEEWVESDQMQVTVQPVPPPSISGLTPTVGTIGSAVTSIAATVPAGATSGNVVVTAGGQASNGVAFTVTGGVPQISAVTPSSGVAGQAIALLGTNFGASPGSVTLNGAAAAILAWSPTRVDLRVPLGLPLTTVPVVLSANGQQASTSFAVVAEQVSYYHTDALGSVRLLTDAAGQPVSVCDYLPFGQDWQSTGDVDECRFAQTERSSDTGTGSWQDLNYAGARYYHSQTGRFTSPDDPIYIDPLNPQTWNLYAYVMNNPLRWVDPSGHQSECTFTPPDNVNCQVEVEGGSVPDLDREGDQGIRDLIAGRFSLLSLLSLLNRVAGQPVQPALPPQDATLVACHPGVIKQMKTAYDNTRINTWEYGFGLAGSPGSLDIGEVVTDRSRTSVNIRMKVTAERPLFATVHTHPTGDWRTSTRDENVAKMNNLLYFVVAQRGLGFYDGVAKAKEPVLLRPGLEWQRPCQQQ